MLKLWGNKLTVYTAALLFSATTAYGILPTNGSLNDGIPSIVYNSLDGSVWIETGTAFGGPSSLYNVSFQSFDGIFNPFRATGVVSAANDFFISTTFGLELPDGTLLGEPGFMFVGENPGFLQDDLTFTFQTDPFGTVFTSDLVYFTGAPDIDGDLDGNGFVGIDDLNIVLAEWNDFVPPADPRADPSGDNFVGIDDLNTVLGNWNAGTPPNSAAVPEPGTAVSAAVLMGAYITRQRRR